MTYTSTKVPRFEGTTSWEQYRQVFDTIVLSNGWDDATVGPGARRASQVGLVDALTEHYGFSGTTVGLPATI